MLLWVSAERAPLFLGRVAPHGGIPKNKSVPFSCRSPFRVVSPFRVEDLLAARRKLDRPRAQRDLDKELAVADQETDHLFDELVIDQDCGKVAFHCGLAKRAGSHCIESLKKVRAVELRPERRISQASQEVTLVLAQSCHDAS